MKNVIFTAIATHENPTRKDRLDYEQHLAWLALEEAKVELRQTQAEWPEFIDLARAKVVEAHAEFSLVNRLGAQTEARKLKLEVP